MKRNALRLMVLCAVLAVGLIGCGQKTDPESELQKAVKAMEQTAPAPSAAPVQPASPAPAVQPTQPTPVAPAPPPPAPAQQMNQAMASYKAGNYEDAVTRLQKLRTKAAMTPQQRMALQDAMAAVMTEVYTLAEKGDARAIQAVKQYEQMRNTQR